MLIPSTALPPAADASNIPDLVQTTSLTTMPTTTKDASASILDDQFKHFEVAVLHLVAAFVILEAAFVYNRCWCSHQNTSTLKIVLHISGISNQVAISVWELCGHFKDILVRNGEEKFKLQVEGLYFKLNGVMCKMVHVNNLEPQTFAKKVFIGPQAA